MSQLVRLSALVRDEYEVTLAAYENDSTDGTGEWLHNTATNPLSVGIPFPFHVFTQTLGTQQYGSVWSIDRIRNLAAARNKCLDIAETVPGKLVQFDKIAYIEPDVSYDPEWCKELILARHPRAAGLAEPHVYSGWSLRTTKHPKESVFLYDTCATRQSKEDSSWDFEHDGAGFWRGASLIKTDLGGVDNNCLHRVWSTFNCFCVYDATPFKEGKWDSLYPNGLRWGYVNKRFDPSGIRIEDGDYGSGWLDSDTSILCEDMHKRGYNNILINTNCLIRHD